ncbi:MAG: PDZ domain-containing protein, partial [Acetobacteraceae bacterium]|nr:PDZ domain-containing protein [Acetobacteraceae bacterium]
MYSAALSFILPRAIIAVPVSQLTLWGLQGLSALDPELAPRLAPGTLELDAGGRVLLRIPAPAFNDPDAWGLAAASICAAAWRDSVLLQRAGPQAMVDRFFQEMLGHLDPYSRYVPPQEALADEARRSGSAGIGITLTKRDKWIVVSTITPEGPAYTAGIRLGDRIIYVAGHIATGRPLATVENWLAGPAGSAVAVSWHGVTGRLHTADITRELIAPETVFPEQRKAMLLLRLTGFSRATDERVATDILQA